jgi:hypothetical protein
MTGQIIWNEDEKNRTIESRNFAEDLWPEMIRGFRDLGCRRLAHSTFAR